MASASFWWLVDVPASGTCETAAGEGTSLCSEDRGFVWQPAKPIKTPAATAVAPPKRANRKIEPWHTAILLRRATPHHACESPAPNNPCTRATRSSIPKESFIVIPYSRIPSRSEERRVGKECRAQWSPHH